MNGLRARLVGRLTALLFLLPLVPSAHAQLTGTLNFLVLRVQFKDMTGTTFTDAQTQTMFNDIQSLWGTDSSYSAMTPNFRLTSLYKLPQNTSAYVDVGGNSSSGNGFNTLVADAVAKAPAGTNFKNLSGLIVLFADNRAGGFYRGITFQGVTINPPGGSISLPVSVVGEDPNEGLPTNWGRIAHEIGHEMQQNSPPHPSDYNSSFEQMDAEYPAQTGMFEKQAARGFPGWMPPAKYFTVSASKGAVVTLLAEEANPSSEPDAQAAKASLSFGGSSVYYMVSVRRRRGGDDLATTSPLVSPTDCVAAGTPNGIPDCGVLIERVVENGDPNVQDCDPQFGCTNRWVDVLGKGGNALSLWHEGDAFTAATYGKASAKNDGITIAVLKKLDQDHYQVAVRYDDVSAKAPDVGLESWLQPPGNTYESTDIWIDSPLNGYASPPDSDAAHYRYGVHSDLRGGVVPIGNGDNPAVGQANRIYARIRNYGTQPATNVTVFFDVTDPPGLGINGSNGFKQLGSVDSTNFPGLASIAPGDHVDVFLNWTPNFPLTQQQIADGQFFFHTCVRIRVSHVAGETFFANQDGDGQQENIDYFDATGTGGSAGAPGPANKTVIHLRNDSPSQPKSFMLGVLRTTLPTGWDISVNGGNNLVQLAPGAEKDVPVAIKQNIAEPIGSSHQVRIIASSIFTFTNPQHPTPHDEARQLGGVTIEANVVRKTKVTCQVQNGRVVGAVAGLDPRDMKQETATVAVVPVEVSGSSIRLTGRLVLAPLRAGKFTGRVPVHGKGVCLYAGSAWSSASGSAPFTM